MYFDLNADGFYDAADLNGDGYVDAVDTDGDGYLDTYSQDAYADPFTESYTYEAPDPAYPTVGFDPAADLFGGDAGYGGSSYGETYGYTPDQLAQGYSSYDSSFIEPPEAAGANSLISDNDLGSVL
jgi:hypothetical protein